ncbi:MAG TPA: efflux RND transporter periplasmic adaptor subunit [Hyphomicrobium sp.]|nr:efflux RND transporter periplasmic adaptor subunit [Hyphomicrobium sp.]
MQYRSVLSAVLLLALAAGATYWIKSSDAPSGHGQNQGHGTSGRRGAQGDSAAVVSAARVQKQTVPVYRQGIGNVQALNSVMVRAQVDGRLLSVDFVEGQDVKKGDVLARIDPDAFQAQYDQAVAKKAQDEATLANARVDLVRYQQLAKASAGPQQQADQQAAVVAQLTAQIAADQASINLAKVSLDYTTITSPLDGRAGLRQIDPGNIIHASDVTGLVTIAQLKPIAVLFTLPQRDIGVTTQADSLGKVTVEIPNAEGTSIDATGTLLSIDNQVDVSTGTIKLKASFPNDDQKLWPGQFVSVRVIVDTLLDAKVVPSSAIRRAASGNFVYVVGADNKAMVQPVDVVLQNDQIAVVGKGIDFDQLIVIEGFSRLTDGQAVAISPASDSRGAVPIPTASESREAAPSVGLAPSDTDEQHPNGERSGAHRRHEHDAKDASKPESSGSSPRPVR